MMTKCKKQNKKQNQGFSLFTVIVAVAFVGILSLLVLYIAMSNFYMKVTDYKGKDSFYTAEQALEEIRTGLAQDVGEAMSSAYVQVLENYSQDDLTSTDISLDEIRQSNFNDLFVEILASRLKGTNENIYNIDKLNEYLDIVNSSVYDSSKETLLVTTPADKTPVMVADLKNGVLLKNIKVIYVDSKGRASVIETDIRLSIPKVQFPTPSTLPDLMNMIVVAGGGIICEGDQVKSNSIQGNIYAGLLDKASLEGEGINNADGMNVSILVKSGGDLSISYGNRAVCQGEISVREGASFLSAGEVALWAQGLTLASANVSLLGTTYFSDDLTAESGKNSKVILSGEYYGYGSSDSAGASYSDNYYDDRGITGSDLSSAIVINGKNTTMDLSGLSKMMLAGRNYISTSKVTSGVQDKTNSNDILMGESLTVKGTQLAYLVPSQLLGDGTGTNPMDYDTYMELLNEGDSISVDMDSPVDVWNGKSLRQLGVDSTKPVQEVFFNSNSENGSVYFYLNFSSEDKAADFMNLYYQNYGNLTTKDSMDKYLSFYFGDGSSGIRINDPKTYTRYITNGNVLSYDGSTGKGTLNSATASHISGSSVESALLQEQISYQNTWYTLNRKMIGSYDLLKTNVKDSDGNFHHNETEYGRNVFDNLVNEEKMKQFVREKAQDTYLYRYTASADNGSLSLIMADNESDGATNNTIEITDTEAADLRLIVCTGDVRLKSGVTFKGIIMAKGKIIMEPGSSVISAPLEAAKVFQAQLGETENDMSAQDFFWEGDKYVLGSSTITEQENENRTSNVYNLADCITYENWKKK